MIDDTFNANPASATAALKLLKSLPLTGRRVVVTPGLVELGREQYGENLALARKVAFYGAELVIVNRTNAVPLTLGFEGPCAVSTPAIRPSPGSARRWCRATACCTSTTYPTTTLEAHMTTRRGLR